MVGSGPRPIPVRKLTADKLIAALSEVESDSLRRQASRIGKTIRAEDGIGEMIKLIETFNTNK